MLSPMTTTPAHLKLRLHGIGERSQRKRLKTNCELQRNLLHEFYVQICTSWLGFHCGLICCKRRWLLHHGDERLLKKTRNLEATGWEHGNTHIQHLMS